MEYSARYSMHEIELFGALVMFVRVGHPYTSDWLPYPSSVAEIYQSTQVVSSYHPAECSFWLTNGFYSYSRIL
ncbi:hypothetical protein ACJMK2_002728 [Sinanodonta woodiana]|uniref:Uncharacterized protein n=1 Tax=Sinanodonta woodiana TaxID=1069815 RepID=A0ABD3XXY5_SINWO